MSILETFVISAALAMDCFAVSLGCGTSGFGSSRRSRFRLSFHFGFFQGGMTFLGWLLGTTVVGLISSVDHWIALALLSWVGIRMIIEGANPKDEEKPTDDPTRGKTMVLLSIATSIDALAVGISLAMLQVNILFSCLIIGLVSLLFSRVGLSIGCKLGEHFGKKMEIVGGVVLVGIGLKILLSHLFGW